MRDLVAFNRSLMVYRFYRVSRLFSFACDLRKEERMQKNNFAQRRAQLLFLLCTFKVAFSHRGRSLVAISTATVYKHRAFR